MTDEIHGSWFSERRKPLRRAQSSDAEGEAALRAALHLAVGEIRGLLGGASGQLREGEPFHSVLRRIGDHGVVVTLQDGRLDVPADQILAAPTAKDWASRSIMYYVVRELAVDEGLRSLFLAAEGDESEPSGPGDSGLGEVPDVLAAPVGSGEPRVDDLELRLRLLGSVGVWRTHVAEPLAEVDKLWTSAWRGVLRREPDALDVMRQLDHVLPPIPGGDAPAPQATGIFLDTLRRRINEGAIAWDEVAPADWRPTALSAAGQDPDNPWLRSHAEDGSQDGEGLAAAALAEVEGALVSLWDWVRQMCTRLYENVSKVRPLAAAVYWEVVARALAAFSPRTPADADEQPEPETVESGFDDATVEIPLALGPDDAPYGRETPDVLDPAAAAPDFGPQVPAPPLPRPPQPVRSMYAPPAGGRLPRRYTYAGTGMYQVDVTSVVDNIAKTFAPMSEVVRRAHAQQRKAKQQGQAEKAAAGAARAKAAPSDG